MIVNIDMFYLFYLDFTAKFGKLTQLLKARDIN